MHQHHQCKDIFPLFNVVLVEPEIPGNTGNIGRTCVGMNSCLHIVGRPSFDLNNKMVRRAGLDYWPHLKLIQHKCFSDFENHIEHVSRLFFLSTKAIQTVFEREYKVGDYFVFGSETKGLHQDILKKYEQQVVGLPMLGPIRSHNLSNAVTAVMYEATRQVLYK